MENYFKNAALLKAGGDGDDTGDDPNPPGKSKN